MKSIQEAQNEYDSIISKAKADFSKAVLDVISENMHDILLSDSIVIAVKDCISHEFSSPAVDSVINNAVVENLIRGVLIPKKIIQKSVKLTGKELALTSPASSFTNAKFKAVRYEDINGKILIRIEGSDLAKLLMSISAELTKYANFSFEDYDDYAIGNDKVINIDIINERDYDSLKNDFESAVNVGKKSKQRYLKVLKDSTKQLLVCSRSGALSNAGRIKIAKDVLSDYTDYIDLTRIIFELK